MLSRIDTRHSKIFNPKALSPKITHLDLSVIAYGNKIGNNNHSETFK